MSVKVEGADRLAAQLLKLAGQRDEICTEALGEWADDVYSEARRAVPMQTGALRDAIEDQVNRSALEAEVGVWPGNRPGAGGDDPAVYAEWTENGNSRQEAQPFLLPAFHRNRNLRPYVRDALHRRL